MKALPAILALSAVLALPAPAAVVWTFGAPGISVVSISADGTNPNDPAQQDILAPSVTITRAQLEGIFNINDESAYQRHTSPAGTEWAFAGLGPSASLNPTGAAFGAEHWMALTFEPWAISLGLNGFLSDRPIGSNLKDNIVGTPGVMHIIEEDIYLDIVFTEWGGAAGTWAYERAAGPIPEPSLPLLLGLAAAGILRRRR